MEKITHQSEMFNFEEEERKSRENIDKMLNPEIILRKPGEGRMATIRKTHVGHGDAYSNDIEYLLSKLEIAEKALTYYTELYRNLYANIQKGELYQHWLERQGQTAVEALQQIRE